MRGDDERKGESETRCRFIACSSQKAPRGPPGLTSPSDGQIAINSTICLLNIHTAEGFLYSILEKVEVRVTMCNCFACSVIVLCGMMMMKGREKVKPGAGS